MKQEFPTPSIWHAHRVSYGETDMMGVVYYAEYLHFFERARDAYIRVSGESYTSVEEKGILLPVREVQCRYRASARFDEVIHTRVGVAEWSRASMTFLYEIWNEDHSRLLITGMTQHASVNRDGVPVRMPEWLKKISESVQDGLVVTL